ncbi:MAG: primosomal protein N' [Candidatus Zixiibacteriota bacterium]
MLTGTHQSKTPERASRLVDVAVARPLDQRFTYRVPPEWCDRIGEGSCVQVPLRGQSVPGVVVAVRDDDKCSAGLKTVSRLVEPEYPVPPMMLQLAHWIAEYYMSPLGDAISALGVGRGAAGEVEYTLTPLDASRGRRALERVTPSEQAVLNLLKPGVGTTVARLMRLGLTRAKAITGLRRLEDRGLITASWKTKFPPIPIDSVVTGIPSAFQSDLSDDEHSLIDQGGHPQGQTWVELAKSFPGGRKRLRQLMIDGRVLWDPMASAVGAAFTSSARPEPGRDSLDTDQRRACETVESALQSGGFKTFLLWGPTGSGKTAVYCEAIRKAWSIGKRVLFLVPEISLAGPMIARLRATLREPIGVWHSALTSSQRYWMARHVQSGRYRVVVGARSAVLAPLPDCGLIIVDEEHADAYKQSDPSPRYHARDVAVKRAQLERAVCVLGSATPSSESYHNAQTGKFELLRLRRRVKGRRMPLVQIVDLSRRRIAKDGLWVGDQLREAIVATIESGQKAIVFINRRGYASMVGCEDCGHFAQCPNCALTLTYHASDRTVRCHLCAYSKPAESSCPKCGGAEFVFHGVGTQRIEEALQSLGDSVRMARLDADIAARRGAAEDILSGFAGDRFNLLLGTQMVAKGLDVARVGLVGVIWADQHMAFPDFRAEERTFQMLTQVAGRAGRGQATDDVARVVVQTFRPEHDLIELAAAQDTALFFERELPRREKLKYPPYSHLILLEFSGDNRGMVRRHAVAFADHWRTAVRQIGRSPGTLLGPSPAAIARRAGEYQYHVLIKATALKATRQIVGGFRDTGAANLRRDAVRLTIDVDPVDFW